MVMETNPQGWKNRRAKAERRRHRGDPEERAKIRAIRAAHRMGEAPEPEASDEQSEWDALAEQLRARGEFVHPRSKVETLRKKLEESDAEEASSEDEA